MVQQTVVHISVPWSVSSKRMESPPPNELFIKLEDLAKGWYVHTFPDPDTFPPWSQVTSGLLNRFGP